MHHPPRARPDRDVIHPHAAREKQQVAHLVPCRVVGERHLAPGERLQVGVARQATPRAA